MSVIRQTLNGGTCKGRRRRIELLACKMTTTEEIPKPIRDEKGLIQLTKVTGDLISNPYPPLADSAPFTSINVILFSKQISVDSTNLWFLDLVLTEPLTFPKSSSNRSFIFIILPNGRNIIPDVSDHFSYILRTRAAQCFHKPSEDSAVRSVMWIMNDFARMTNCDSASARSVRSRPDRLSNRPIHNPAIIRLVTSRS